MHRVERSALLPYAREDVFAVVCDVAGYPEFLRWCRAASVLETGEGEVVASMEISARDYTETLVTRNRMTPPETVTLDLVEGPFRAFSGAWTFTALGDAGCRVDLWVEFEFDNRVIDLMATPFLGRVADVVVDAFADRVRTLFGAA